MIYVNNIVRHIRHWWQQLWWRLRGKEQTRMGDSSFTTGAITPFTGMRDRDMAVARYKDRQRRRAEEGTKVKPKRCQRDIDAEYLEKLRNGRVGKEQEG